MLKPNKTQAFAVAALYSLLGKKILYLLIAKFEYAAITFLVFLGFLFVGAATDPNPAHLQHI